MIEQAYRAFERQQREAEEWYGMEQAGFHERPAASGKAEKRRQPSGVS